MHQQDFLRHYKCFQSPVQNFLVYDPVSKIDDNFQQLFPNKDQKIILYCARGGRAGQAKEILSRLGYTNLENGGGILDVSKRLNLPIVKN